jgi:putative transposase
MSNRKYDPDNHRRRSIRLPSFDYASPGAYYVTICTVDRYPFFEHAQLRAILERTWYELPQHVAGLMLDAFVVMPNHIHFIVWLSQQGKRSPPLGLVVGGYKSSVVNAWIAYLNETGQVGVGTFWQRNYYERVLRNTYELNEKRIYIRNNPIKDALQHNQPDP